MNVLFETELDGHDVKQIVKSLNIADMQITFQYDIGTKCCALVFLEKKRTMIIFAYFNSVFKFKNNNDFNFSIPVTYIKRWYNDVQFRIYSYDEKVYNIIIFVLPSVLASIVAEYVYDHTDIMYASTKNIPHAITYVTKIKFTNFVFNEYKCNEYHYRLNSSLFVNAIRKINDDYVNFWTRDTKLVIFSEDETSRFELQSLDSKVNSEHHILVAKSDLLNIKHIYSSDMIIHFNHTTPLIIKYDIKNMSVLIAMSPLS